MEHIEAKGIVTKALFVQQAMGWMKKRILWNTLFIGVCVFVLFSLAVDQSWLYISVISLFGMVAYVALIMVAFQRDFQKQYSQTPFMQEEQHFVFKTQEMCRYIRNGQQCWEWKELTKIVETEDGFRIHPTPKQVIVLPKHFFSSQEDIKQMHHLWDNQFHRTKNQEWEHRSTKT